MALRISLAALAVVAFTGCGATALQRHAMAAEALDAALDADAEAFEARVRLEVRRGAQGCPEEGFAACVEAEAHGVVEGLEPWEAAHNAAVAARDAYVERLRLASGQGVDNLSILEPLIREALLAFRRLSEIAHSYHVDVPSVAEGFRWLTRLL
jgi:hypothetical protein